MVTGEWVSAWLALQASIRATCRRLPCQADPARWSSTAPADVAGAVDGCYDCPLMVPCGAYAVAAGERDGVWGGLTPAERAGRRAAG